MGRKPDWARRAAEAKEMGLPLPPLPATRTLAAECPWIRDETIDLTVYWDCGSTTITITFYQWLQILRGKTYTTAEWQESEGEYCHIRWLFHDRLLGVFTDNDTSPGEIFDGSCTDSEISHEYETCRWNYEDEGEVEEACEAWDDDSDDDSPRRRRGRKPLPPDVDLFELCSEAPAGPARDLKSEFRPDGDR